MKVSKAVNLFLDYHKLKSQKNTIRAYGSLLAKFRVYFPDQAWLPHRQRRHSPF